MKYIFILLIAAIAIGVFIFYRVARIEYDCSQQVKESINYQGFVDRSDVTQTSSGSATSNVPWAYQAELDCEKQQKIFYFFTVDLPFLQKKLN